MTFFEKHTDHSTESPGQFNPLIQVRPSAVPMLLDPISPEEAWRLLFELQARQLDLIIQTKELRHLQQRPGKPIKQRDGNSVIAQPGCCFLNRSKLILEADQIAGSLLGDAGGSLVGQPFTNLILVEDEVVFRQNLDLIIKERLPRVWDQPILKCNGSVFWALIHGSLHQDSECEDRFRLVLTDITDSKRIESSIRRLSIAVEQSPVSVVITDTTGAIEYVNPKYTEMTGYSRSEARGRIPQFLKKEEPPPESVEGPWATILAGNTWRGVSHNKKKNGEPFWEQATISPIRDEQGVMTHFIAIKEDITKQRQSEAEMFEKEEQLRLFVEYSPAAITMLDTRLNYLVVSKRWLEDFGLPEQGVVGRNLYEVSPEIPERLKAIHRRCLAGAIERCDEDPFPRADGTLDWLRWEIRPWNRLDGSVGGLIIFSEIITMTKRLREESKGRLALLHSIVNGTTDAICVKDLQGRYLLVNAAAEQLLGKGAADLLGHDSHFAYPPGIAEAVMDDDRRIMEAKAVSTEETSLPDAAGRNLLFLSTKGPIFEADGTVAGLFEVSRDITERNRAEVALRESNDLLSDFIAQSPIFAFIKEVTPTQSRMLHMSNNFDHFFGKSSSELVGKPMADLFPASMAERVISDDWAVILSGRGREKTEEYRGRTYTGFKFPIVLGERALLAGFSIDITEQEQFKRLLAVRNEQLHLAIGRLQRAQEEERVRVSREIHDELGQLLTGLKMDVRWLERKLSAPGVPPALHPLLDRVVGTSELADAMIATVQRIAAELRPGMLDVLGLEASLDLEARRFQERSGIACTVIPSAVFPTLPPEIANDLFYICREALTNVGRHAEATRVVITCHWEGETAVFAISDDGVGITEVELAAPCSLGLTGMQERARQCGGAIAFERNTPSGTRVEVRVPCTSFASDRELDQ